MIVKVFVALAYGALVSAAFTQSGANDVIARVDHLVYATPDLAAGVATVEALLGVRATPGG